MIARALGWNVVALLGLFAESLSSFELQAVSAIIRLLTAFKSSNALVGTCAPGFIVLTLAKSSCAIVVNRIGTIAGDVVARVSGSTPSSCWLIGDTFTSAVKGVTTAIDFNAFSLNSVPDGANRAYAFASSAIVIVQASNWLFIAFIGFTTQTEIGLVSNATTAVIVASTTGRNFNALLGSQTPALADRAQTASVVCIKTIGASVGNVEAFLFLHTPSSIFDVSQALASVIVSITAPGNFNAFIFLGIPSESSGANTFKSGTIMVVWASGRDGIATLGFGAPAISILVSYASTAAVIFSTTVGNGNTNLLNWIPDVSS